MRISDWSSDVCSSDLCAQIGRGDGRVKAFEPTIEPYEFVVAKPARALNLGFGRDSGCRIEGNTDAARRGVPLIVVRFPATAEDRVDVVPYMVSHFPGTPIVAQPD